MAAPKSIETEPATGPNYDPFDGLAKGIVPGDIVNAEAGYQYTYAATKDYAGAAPALADWRAKHRARGFEPINGPEYKGPQRPEYHASEPSAEIWRRPQSRRDDEWRAETAQRVFNRNFASYYLRHTGALPWLPVRLRDAMFTWHGLKGDGKGEKHTPELRAEIINLCRRMPVHPGRMIEE